VANGPNIFQMLLVLYTFITVHKDTLKISLLSIKKHKTYKIPTIAESLKTSVSFERMFHSN